MGAAENPLAQPDSSPLWTPRIAYRRYVPQVNKRSAQTPFSRRWAVPLLGVGLAMSAALLVAQPGVAAAVDVGVECGAGKVFIGSGSADPDSVHTRGLEDRYTAQGYLIEVTDYPASFWPLGTISYDESSRIGHQRMLADITDYNQACPQSPIVVVGYSEGARFAGDVLSDIGNNRTAIDPALVSGELYSDPRRDGDVSGAGVETRLAGVWPGATMTGSRPGGFGAAAVVSVCVDGDMICDMPDPLHNPVGALDSFIGIALKHVTYDDDMALGPSGIVDYSDVFGDSLLIKAPPAFATVFGLVGLPNLLPEFSIDLPYPDLAALQPWTAELHRTLPELPDLGYGGHLPDITALGAALSLEPAGLWAIADSVRSIIAMPVNIVRAWAGSKASSAKPVTATASTTKSAVTTSREPLDLTVPGSADRTPLTEPTANHPAPPSVSPSTTASAKPRAVIGHGTTTLTSERPVGSVSTEGSGADAGESIESSAAPTVPLAVLPTS